MKEKIRAEKEWLKTMAIEIRKKRKEWKENQRAYHFMERPSTMNWEENMRERGRMFKAFRQLEQWGYEYRHRHIAYSMAKGRTYFEVERSVREGNDPDFTVVAIHLQDKYNLNAEDLKRGEYGLPKKLVKAFESLQRTHEAIQKKSIFAVI